MFTTTSVGELIENQLGGIKLAPAHAQLCAVIHPPSHEDNLTATAVRRGHNIMVITGPPITQAGMLSTEELKSKLRLHRARLLPVCIDKRNGANYIYKEGAMVSNHMVRLRCPKCERENRMLTAEAFTLATDVNGQYKGKIKRKSDMYFPCASCGVSEDGKPLAYREAHRCESVLYEGTASNAELEDALLKPTQGCELIDVIIDVFNAKEPQITPAMRYMWPRFLCKYRMGETPFDWEPDPCDKRAQKIVEYYASLNMAVRPYPDVLKVQNPKGKNALRDVRIETFGGACVGWMMPSGMKGKENGYNIRLDMRR